MIESANIQECYKCWKFPSVNPFYIIPSMLICLHLSFWLLFQSLKGKEDGESRRVSLCNTILLPPLALHNFLIPTPTMKSSLESLFAPDFPPRCYSSCCWTWSVSKVHGEGCLLEFLPSSQINTLAWEEGTLFIHQLQDKFRVTTLTTDAETRSQLSFPCGMDHMYPHLLASSLTSFRSEMQEEQHSPEHTTPASSQWSQLVIPHGLAKQADSEYSNPVQFTPSSHTISDPWPN